MAESQGQKESLMAEKDAIPQLAFCATAMQLNSGVRRNIDVGISHGLVVQQMDRSLLVLWPKKHELRDRCFINGTLFHVLP